MLDLRLLEWFCCAYDTRSFAKAAKLVFVSRQAFGKSIKTMERELGVVLFEREASGVRPTEFAEIMYPQARACINDYRGILKARDEFIADRRQNVRFALADGVAVALPNGLWERLVAAIPSAELIIEKHRASRCLDLLKEGQVDFAICSLPLSGYALERIRLIHYDLYVAVPRQLIDFPLDTCTLEDLATLTFFTLGNNLPDNEALVRLFASHGLELHTNSQYQDYDIILNEVKRGAKGASIVPANCLDQVASEHVAVFPFPDPSLRWELDVLFLDRPYTDVELRVISFMRERSWDQSA
jgi:DNA-binding transcriptional LysR family regulator